MKVMNALVDMICYENTFLRVLAIIDGDGWIYCGTLGTME